MFGLLIPILSDLIKLFPNAEQRERAVQSLRDFEIEVAKGQLNVNAVEAANQSIFVSGWRPAVGWICVVGFTYQIIQPPLHLPVADLNVLLTILGGMLGLGTLRTVEKVKGVG